MSIVGIVENVGIYRIWFLHRWLVDWPGWLPGWPMVQKLLELLELLEIAVFYECILLELLKIFEFTVFGVAMAGWLTGWLAWLAAWLANGS